MNLTAITETPINIIRDVLVEAGLIDPDQMLQITPMSGGVSSCVWKVAGAHRALCVKQPLSQLQVDNGWHAPLERSRYEAQWNEIANRVAPGSAPRVRHHDDTHMVLVMDYLDPQRFHWWKDMLRQGRAAAGDAVDVGRLLARIHSATVGDPSLSGLFPRTDIEVTEVVASRSAVTEHNIRYLRTKFEPFEKR